LTKNDKYWRTLSLIILGGLVLYKQYKSFQEDLMFDIFIFLFLGFLGFVIFIWTIYKDYKNYIKLKSLTSYIPTLTGLLLIICIVGLQKLKSYKMNAPSLLQAYYKGDLSGVDIDLKKDGNYIISNGGFGGVNYFYGNYSIQDSIITLDKPNIDNVINTNTLVIRKHSEKFQLNSKEGIERAPVVNIFQINKNGDDIKTDIIFRVIKDDRKTILNNKSTIN